MEQHKINTIFHNNKDDIEESVYQMMIEWQKRQRDREEAYCALWKALTDEEVNLSSIAYEVLKNPPIEDINTKPTTESVEISSQTIPGTSHIIMVLWKQSKHIE